ncbi:PQQ-binding-like beta-propeller repeat protein [Myxococcota bacterium]|nr:PQQ-binding-like beta-propeller repeat protein [Myxococcota bacterium]
MDRRKFLQGLAAGAGAAFLAPRLSSSDPFRTPAALAAPHTPPPASAPVPVAGSDVTMFRGNPAHTFYGTGPIRDQLQILWTFQMGNFTSPISGKVWSGTGWTGTAVAVGDWLYVGSQDSWFYALDRNTGALRWKYKAGAMFKGSCAYFAGRVFTGCVDDHIYCFHAKTGQVLWTYNTGTDCDSSPTIYKGRLYIAGESGFVHCFRPDTGALIWRTFVDGKEGPGGSNGAETTPAIADDRVYVANFTGYLFCLRADNGALIWKAKTGDDTDASPAVSGGLVFAAAEQLSPYLFAFDAKTGAERWRFGGSFTRGFWATPAVVGNRVFIGADNGRMYCLDALTGKQLWEYAAGDSIWSSPAIVDNRVIFGSYDSHVHMVAADTGRFISKIQLKGRVLSSPCIVGGKIYIGTAEGMYYCLG